MAIAERCWPLLALVLLWAAGCGAAPSASALSPVHGKVTYRGQPLAAGTIVFSPNADRGTLGELAYGEIQADGSYRLHTRTAAGPVPGAVAGWHRVTVMAVELLPPAAGQPQAQPRSILPPRYSDPQLSGLLCEVKAGRENVLNFNLE